MKEIECHFTPRRAPSRSSEVAYESPPNADQVRRRFNASARSRPRWWSKFGGAGGCVGGGFGLPTADQSVAGVRRVEMWRGGCRSNISVAVPFIWRCLTGSAVAPFPHPAHRTGLADFPHPALGQDVTPSPTPRRAPAGSGVRDRSARKGAGVDKLRPCVARPCA